MSSTFPSNGSTNVQAETQQAAEAGVEATTTVVQDAMAASVVADRVEVSDSLVISLVADEVTATDTLIVVGTVGSLSGDAQVLISPQAAMAFGAALGLVLAVAGRLLRGRTRADQQA